MTQTLLLQFLHEVTAKNKLLMLLPFFTRIVAEAHLHSALKFVTPTQRHNGQADAILSKRDAVYQAAKQGTQRAGLNDRRVTGNCLMK